MNDKTKEAIRQHHKQLLGVADILRAIDKEGGDLADAAGLAAKAADETADYLYTLADPRK